MKGRIVGQTSGKARFKRSFRAHVLPPPAFEVDPNLRADVAELPAFEGSGPRRLATMTDASGIQGDFVVDELLLMTDDSAALKAFTARWQGTVVATISPPGIGSIHLVRIAAPLADRTRLASDLRTLDPLSRGAHRVSSEEGLGLFAVAAEEAVRGVRIGVNWVGRSDVFEDRVTTEAPGQASGSGYGPNPFGWSYAASGNDMDTGLGDAWRGLEMTGRLGNRVKIAILDGGFRTNADLPPFEASSVVPGLDAMSALGAGSSPYHGTHVALAAAGVANNSFGTAGAAAPVGDLVLVYTTYDVFFGIAAVFDAIGRGARIINMSYHSRVPAVFSFSVLPFNFATDVARSAGVLLFAAAGNEGADVDEEDCFGLCWEAAWYTPCENDGVTCVGGVESGGRWRHAKSNWGRKQVDISGPYSVYSLNDPSAPADNRVQTVSGTSVASPVVAGVAALVWAANPGFSAEQVASTLRSTAHRNPDDQKTPRGWVDALAAVKSGLGGGNIAPTVQITSPATGVTVGYGGSLGGSLEVVAVARDLEDGVPCCTITWTSDVDGVLGTGGAHFLTFPGPGRRTITATATDSAGATSAGATIVVDAVNLPPAPTMVKPGEGETWYVGAPYLLSGRATDVNEGNLPCDALEWSVSQVCLKACKGDRQTGTGCDVPVTFHFTGRYSVALTATDSLGAKYSISRHIEVDEAPAFPVVTILKPTPLAALDPSHVVILLGTATGSPTAYHWTVELGGVETPIGGSAVTFWRPADTVFRCGPTNVAVRMYATNEHGTASSAVSVILNFVPC